LAATAGALRGGGRVTSSTALALAWIRILAVVAAAIGLGVIVSDDFYLAVLAIVDALIGLVLAAPPDACLRPPAGDPRSSLVRRDDPGSRDTMPERRPGDTHHAEQLPRLPRHVAVANPGLDPGRLPAQRGHEVTVVKLLIANDHVADVITEQSRLVMTRRRVKLPLPARTGVGLLKLIWRRYGRRSSEDLSCWWPVARGRMSGTHGSRKGECERPGLLGSPTDS
jgi:hypothetical protein